MKRLRADAPLVRTPRHRALRRTVATGIGFTLLVVAAAWTPPRTLSNLEGRTYDTFLRSAPHRPAGAVPVVVDIDEESLARYGQWPWPRYRVARLLERVRDLGAAAIALDIVFAEPDRTSLPLIAREIERDLGGVVRVGDSADRAAAVLEGRVPEAALAGRVAFVGTTAAGLKELRATPLDPIFTVELLFKLAPLHDIGKVGVRDHVLLKPERLTRAEYEEMKRHLGDDSFLRIAREFALTHQEKWDGSGYPQGLKGEEIPIAGRLMAVADVYDALVSRRIYKEPLSHREATAILAQGRGTHFDPDVTDAFLAHEDQFAAIAARFSDSSAGAAAGGAAGRRGH